MKYLDKAIKDRFVIIDKRHNKVTYLPHQKIRPLKNPEEQIQLEAFLELIYGYGYPAHRIKVSDIVKMGSATKEADIMVYRDDDCKSPFIVVECKRREVSKKQFDGAVDQGFSYAASTGADYVWTTSGRYEAHFEVWKQQIMEREGNRLPRIPKFSEKRFAGWYKFQTKVFRGLGKGWRRLWENPIFTDTMLYAGTITLFVTIFSKLAVTSLPQIYSATEQWWQHWMHFGHLFNVIVVLSTIMTLLAGGFFMRSHRLFGASKRNRRIDFIIIALILYLPAWYMSVSNSNPDWWTWAHYKRITWQTKIYIWPFLKALPLQAMAVYGMIWVATRGKSNSSKSKRRVKQLRK